MKFLFRFARSARCNRNPNPRHGGKEKAMDPVTAIIVAILMSLGTLSATAVAEARIGAAKAKPAKPFSRALPGSKSADTKSAKAENAAPSPLFEVKSWEELARLVSFVDRYYHVTMQAEYVSRQAKPSVEKIVGKGPKFKRFGNLFKAFRFILSATGDKVPATTQAAFLSYLKAHGCEKEDGKWSGGCNSLWKEVKAAADKAMKAAPDSDFKANAKKLLDTAGQYAEYEGKPLTESAGDAVILAHGAIAAVTPLLSEANRPWKLSASSLAGKPACFLPNGEEARCGTVEKSDDSAGITINGETVPWDKILDGGPALAFGDVETIRDNWGKKAGGGTKNDGLHLRPEFMYNAIFAPDQTNVHVVRMGLGIGWTFPSFPITLMANAGALNSPGGGVASHYSHLARGGDRWTGYAGGGVGFRPKFADWIGLYTMVSGFATFNGGGGMDVAVGPEFYVTKGVSLTAAAQAGYMDLGKPFGDNPGSSLVNPRAQGGTLGASVSGTFNLF